MKATSTRVLVVEDEPCDAGMVRRNLRSDPGSGERFEVRNAATLAQGLEQLQRSPVDVLLLDLSLPDSDGLETVVRVRDDDPHVPLVVVTGSEDASLAARAFEAGADEYLEKDALEARVLKRTIRHAIERRRLRLRSSAPARDGKRAPVSEERALLHDLRNLHTVILGNAQILRDDASEQPLRARAEALLRAGRVAAELLEQLLDRSDRKRVPSRPIELSEFVRRAGPVLRAVVPDRIQLQLDLQAGLARANVQVERLFCALLELVVNAVEAIGDADGSLELRTGASVIAPGETSGLIAPEGVEPGPHLWLEVRDSGRGFDLASIDRLLESGVTTKGPGHGYGLSHLQEMLAEHRGALLVRSRPGAGATFRILLRSAG